jgi:hypothetical protein
MGDQRVHRQGGSNRHGDRRRERIAADQMEWGYVLRGASR